MENDSQAIAIGLGAGLGGFAGIVILICIFWHCFCGSWCEKKKVQSIILVPMRDQERAKHEGPHKSHVTTVTSMNNKHTSLDF